MPLLCGLHPILCHHFTNILWYSLLCKMHIAINWKAIIYIYIYIKNPEDIKAWQQMQGETKQGCTTHMQYVALWFKILYRKCDIRYWTARLNRKTWVTWFCIYSKDHRFWYSKGLKVWNIIINYHHTQFNAQPRKNIRCHQCPKTSRRAGLILVSIHWYTMI